MAIIIANHKVKDFKFWKPYYDGDISRRKSFGLKDLVVGTKADDPGEVYMIWETKDPEKAKKMSQDPDLEARMKEAGVTSELHITVVNNGG
jgi:hypothetical protein